MEELPADAYYDLTRPTEVAVSPDGERVAFAASECDPDEDERPQSIFVVPADGGRDPHRLTRVTGAGNLAWSPDGTKLGVVMARDPDLERRVGRDDEDGASDDGDESADGAEEDDADESSEDGENGGEEPKPQVWVYDLELGGDARQVTDRERGVRDFDWGPDGERVVVAARDPTDEETEYLDQREEGGPIETERLQHKFDGQGWLDTVTTYLFVVDVETGEERRLDDARGGGIFDAAAGPQPAWSPTDDRIAFVAYHGEDGDDTYVQDVHLVDAESGDVERLTEGEYTAGAPTWSPDGERLAFTARNPENWYVPVDVCVADPDAGEYAVVTADLDRTIGFFGAPEWTDGESLLAGVGDEGWTRFVRLDAPAPDPAGTGPGGAAGGHERVFDRQTRDETNYWFDADGGTVAVVRSHTTEGADVYAMDAADLDAGPDDPDPRRRLTAVNADLLAEYDHPETTRIAFESDDGTEIEGLVHYPPTFDPADPEPHPVLLWIHGGPMAYDQPGFDFKTSFWASRGYLVLNVNYRGSTSYGREFCEALKGAWNTVEVDDLLAGVDALEARGWADPDRLFVGGFSQGGVNTAYVLTRTDRFAAGVAEHGVYDMRSAFGTDDSHKWFELDFGVPWENPEAYEAASSITDVDAVDAPLLLTAGENDWRCPPTQSEQFYRSLRKRGVEAKLVVYPDEHHNVGNPDRAIHRLETLDDWLARFDPEREGDAEADGEDGSA